MRIARSARSWTGSRDKWSLLAIALLEGRTLRFNELRREIDGISQRMLSVTLRQLERDGHPSFRTVYPVVPPRVAGSPHAARREPALGRSRRSSPGPSPIRTRSPPPAPPTTLVETRSARASRLRAPDPSARPRSSLRADSVQRSRETGTAQRSPIHAQGRAFVRRPARPRRRARPPRPGAATPRHVRDRPRALLGVGWLLAPDELRGFCPSPPAASVPRSPPSSLNACSHEQVRDVVRDAHPPPSLLSSRPAASASAPSGG